MNPYTKAAKLLKANSPVILTSVAIVGTVTTAYLAGRAAIKAYQHMEKLQDRPSDTRQYAKYVLEETWTYFIPPVLIGATTIAAVASSHTISTRRAAAISSAYVISEKALTDYREKVGELFGPSKDVKIQDAIAQDKVTSSPPGPNNVYFTGRGESLFLESFTGRYFKSTIEDVKAAVNKVNESILHYNYCSLSEFYTILGLESTAQSDDVGWNYDKLLEVNFSTALTPEGEPCAVLNYSVVPVHTYSHFG